jgi:fatty acid/phospholipid biosynthesis enzyme
MKTIVIDLPSGLAYPASVLSAFKVYVKKNHFFNLMVCGDSANFSILEDVEGINCRYSPEGESSLVTALKAVNEENDIAGLLSFSDRFSVLTEAKTILPKNVSPCFGLLFSTKTEDKETLLVDASGYTERNEENASMALAYGKDYLTNVLGRAAPDIALLGLSEIEDPLWDACDRNFRQSEKNYHGLLAPSHLFDGGMDLVVSVGNEGAMAILSAKGASTASKQTEKAQAAKSWTSLFGKGKETERPRFDSRIDQRGYFLFGVGKNILCLNKDSGYGDVIDALPRIEHLAFKKAYQK